MLKAPSLCAGKSDYIDASAYFDIKLHVMQSYRNISNVLSCKVKMVKNELVWLFRGVNLPSSAEQMYYWNIAAFTSHTVLEDAAGLGHRIRPCRSLSPKRRNPLSQSYCWT